jgi:ELWxxDGT repeat protein
LCQRGRITKVLAQVCPRARTITIPLRTTLAVATAALGIGGALAAPAGAATGASYLTDIGGTRYFVADDGTHGAELFRSVGAAPATLVKDIAPGSASSQAQDFVTDGSALYFEANDGSAAGWQLFASDGTGAGTIPLTTLITPYNPFGRVVLGAFDGHVYFTKYDPAQGGNELWSSDGTVAETAFLKDVRPGASGSNIEHPTVAGHHMFFQATDGTHGEELWVTDGTAAGTHITKDLAPGSDSFAADGFTAIGDDVYFDGTDGVYVSDGTTAGTHRVAAFSDSHPKGFVAFGGRVWFTADTAGGDGLYKTDGTAAGTSLVKTINPAKGAGAVNDLVVDDLVVDGSTLFFQADGGTGHGIELWSSDGTAAGTHELKDINPNGNSMPALGTVFGNDIYFVADDGGTSGYELWVSDGTAAGTHLVVDLRPGSAGSFPGLPDSDGSTLWFTATPDDTYVPRSYISDGTAAGTRLQAFAGEDDGAGGGTPGDGGGNDGGGDNSAASNAGGGAGATQNQAAAPVAPAAQVGPTPVVAQSAPVRRAVAAKLSLRVGRAAKRYKVSGRLTVPKGSSCHGTVTVTFRRGTRTVAAVRTRLRKDCTYAVTLSKATTKRLGFRRGKLTAAARFAATRH